MPNFEGTIPEKQYGAGKVIIWDKGTWQPQPATPDARKALAAGELKFTVHGHKMHGKWVLVRMKDKGEKQPAWLLIKEKKTNMPGRRWNFQWSTSSLTASSTRPYPGAGRARGRRQRQPPGCPPPCRRSWPRSSMRRRQTRKTGFSR